MNPARCSKFLTPRWDWKAEKSNSPTVLTPPSRSSSNTISSKDYRGENRWLDLQEILIYSSNIGSAQIALKVGKQEQKSFLRNMGLFDPIGSFEVTEKATPSVPNRWGEATTATVSYGYGVSVTPLHIISAFAAVVNGGIYHTPTLLKPTVPMKVGGFFPPKLRRRCANCCAEWSPKARENAPTFPVMKLPAKPEPPTNLSTAIMSTKKVMTSFVATFPVSHPKYALFVMMDEPKASKETFGFATSGWNTVPTAGEIISAIAPQLNVKANYDLDEKRAQLIEASYTH